MTRTRRPVSILVLAVFAMAQAQSPLFDELHRKLPLIAEVTATVALADVDGDGDLDAFVGNAATPDRLMLNDGYGSFFETPGRLPTATGFETSSAAFGDVDGDGDLDLFVGIYAHQNLLYLNDGTGRFQDATSQIPIDDDQTLAVALGDVDGDGDLDAVTACSRSIQPWTSRLYLNNGSGQFTDATGQLPGLVEESNDVALADVDGDGDLDMMIATVGSNRLYLNNGGIFTNAPSPLPGGAQASFAMDVGDVDGDGDLDVYVGNNEFWSYTDPQDRLLLNDGRGHFTDATGRIPADSDLAVDVHLRDLDGDGDLDVLVANTGSSRVYLNDGSGSFSRAPGPLSAFDDEYIHAVALGDVDGDGDPDALIASMVENRLLANDGRGGFTDIGTQVRLGGGTSVALGDLDGDGDLDALIGSAADNRLLLNDGSGGLHIDRYALPAGLPSARAVLLADLDRDGDLDALLATEALNPVLINHGGGRFTLGVNQLPNASEDTHALAAGDVDGDGDVDLVIGNFGQNRLYLNDGSGRFGAAPVPFPAENDSTLALALGDVDGDSDLDLIVANARYFTTGHDGSNYLLINDGTGRFQRSMGGFPVDSEVTTSIALGDVDGDGDLDVLLGHARGQIPPSDQLLLNDGSGNFAEASGSFPTPVASTFSACLVDVDGDGDLDAHLGKAISPEHPFSGAQDRLFLNDGAGGFSDASARLPAVEDGTMAVAFGDLDSDGDADACVVAVSACRVLRNLTRQLAWLDLPRSGYPLTLGLWGPSHGAWQLAASAASVDRPLGPLGHLRLDPGLLILVGQGGLDTQGRGAIRLRVPADPLLVGAALYWQGVQAFPLALTNLEVTAIGD